MSCDGDVDVLFRSPVEELWRRLVHGSSYGIWGQILSNMPQGGLPLSFPKYNIFFYLAQILCPSLAHLDAGDG